MGQRDVRRLVPDGGRPKDQLPQGSEALLPRYARQENSASAERLRCSEGEGDRPGFWLRQTSPNGLSTQTFKLVFPAQGDVSRDQVELHGVQPFPNLLDAFGSRPDGKECELNSAFQGGGSATALVVRRLTFDSNGPRRLAKRLERVRLKQGSGPRAVLH